MLCCGKHCLLHYSSLIGMTSDVFSAFTWAASIFISRRLWPEFYECLPSHINLIKWLCRLVHPKDVFTCVRADGFCIWQWINETSRCCHRHHTIQKRRAKMRIKSKGDCVIVHYRVVVALTSCGVHSSQDPNHTFYNQDTFVPSVCKPARTRWINKVILKVIYHTRIGRVIINFLGESIRGGAERNGSMRCNKLTLITSPWFAQIAYLAIQIIFKFIVAKQIFKDICIIRRYRVIYCAAYH